MNHAYGESTIDNQMQDFALEINGVHRLLLLQLFTVLLPDDVDQKVVTQIQSVCQGKGNYYFSTNYYDATEDLMGIPIHKDFGFLTLLFPEEEGLFAYIAGKWTPVNPKENCCVVLVANQFQLLVNDQEKCNAAWHYVEKMSEGSHRTSFAIASDSAPNQPIYQLKKDGTAKIVFPSSQEYLKHCFANLYGKTKEEIG